MLTARIWLLRLRRRSGPLAPNFLLPHRTIFFRFSQCPTDRGAPIRTNPIPNAEKVRPTSLQPYTTTTTNTHARIFPVLFRGYCWLVAVVAKNHVTFSSQPPASAFAELERPPPRAANTLLIRLTILPLQEKYF